MIYADAIETHYVGPTNTRGARIIATFGPQSPQSRRMRVTVGYDHAAESTRGVHEIAARALMARYNLPFTHLIAASTLRGYVFIAECEDPS